MLSVVSLNLILEFQPSWVVSVNERTFIEGSGFGAAFFDDVDGGATTLFSPTFNLSLLDDAIVTYYRWYTNDIGDNGNNDNLTVLGG